MIKNNVVGRANELLAKIDQRPWLAETEPETWCDAGDDGRTIGGYTGEIEETGAIIVENKDEDGTVTYIADRVWGGNFAFVLAAPGLVRGLIAEVEQRTSQLATVTAERDALAKAIGEAVIALGVARPVPMTGPELIHMLESYVRHEVSQRAARCAP